MGIVCKERVVSITRNLDAPGVVVATGRPFFPHVIVHPAPGAAMLSIQQSAPPFVDADAAAPPGPAAGCGSQTRARCPPTDALLA